MAPCCAGEGERAGGGSRRGACHGAADMDHGGHVRDDGAEALLHVAHQQHRRVGLQLPEPARLLHLLLLLCILVIYYEIKIKTIKFEYLKFLVVDDNRFAAQGTLGVGVGRAQGQATAPTMYQPLSHPRAVVDWRFCLVEGLVRSLLLVVVCLAAYCSYRTVRLGSPHRCGWALTPHDRRCRLCGGARSP